MPLPRAIAVIALEQLAEPPTDTVALSYQDRHRRRMTMTSDGGREFLLDLPQAIAMADGMCLKLDDDGHIRVVAIDEDVLDITTADASTLMRIAWHLGNRHLPTELSAERVRIAYDHVIEEMVIGLGGHVERRKAPFHPEGGAYAHHDHA